MLVAVKFGNKGVKFQFRVNSPFKLQHLLSLQPAVVFLKNVSKYCKSAYMKMTMPALVLSRVPRSSKAVSLALFE